MGTENKSRERWELPEGRIGRVDIGGGEWTRTTDLRIMRPSL